MATPDDMELELAVRQMLLRQRFRATAAGSAAVRASAALFDKAFDDWNSEQDVKEQREKRWKDEHRAIMMAQPRTYPNLKRGSILVTPPRNGAGMARYPEDALRLLQHPQERMARFVWNWQYLRSEDDGHGNQSYAWDLLDNFTDYSAWVSDIDLDERHQRHLARYRRTFMNRAQKHFQDLRIPIIAEMIGDTLWWTYGSGPVKRAEIDYIFAVFMLAAPAQIGRFEERLCSHPDTYKGVLTVTNETAFERRFETVV